MLGGFALKGAPGNTPYVDREMENACKFTDKAEKRVVIRWLNNNNNKKLNSLQGPFKRIPCSLLRWIWKWESYQAHGTG